MYKNYFKTAYRNLLRNRQFTIINIGGLSVGMMVFIFIMQYVAAEWNANRFNKNYSSVYRANVQYKNGNTSYVIPPGFAPLLAKKFPSIEGYTRIADGIAAGVLASNDQNGEKAKVFREDNIVYVDSSFLNIFSFPLVAGNRVLDEPRSMALSEEMSRKLYGRTDVVGKTILVSNQFGKTLYTIKAVYQIPVGSDIHPNAILAIQTLESAAGRGDNDWADPNTLDAGFTSIYFQLTNGTDAVSFAKIISHYVISLNPESKDDKVLLQPLANIHLAPNFNYPLQTFGNLLLVTVFAGIAILILVLGWVNYINLSTAQAMNRARETGVRKVLGASRWQLIYQYLTETLFMTVAAALLALLLVNLLQSTFNNFTGRQFSLAVLNQGWVWCIGIMLILLGAVLSGGYVAFVLTSFSPVSVITGKITSGGRGFSLRKALVVFQFTISVCFIIATVIIYKQLVFMQTENLGMNLNQLLVIQGPTVSSEGQAQKNSSFKNALSNLPFVTKYTASNNVPGIGYNFSTNGIVNPAAAKADDNKKSYSMFICDERYFDTYGISFSQGKTFTAQDAQASWNKVKKVIINEKAAAALGFNSHDNLIGQKIMWGTPYEIVGVVKDYHHMSLREAITPTIYLASGSYGYFTLQTDASNMASKINTLKSLYNNSFAGNPFEYFFADQTYDRQYSDEQKIANVFIAAAIIAIFIACLGLYGLTSFAASQRVKEIGIRKVLGASVQSIAGLLSRDFIRLVIIAIVIAAPVAWWAMQKWLQEFAYRTKMDWWVFALAGAGAVLIALVTISFHAIKAAIANPIRSLRNE